MRAAAKPAAAGLSYPLTQRASLFWLARNHPVAFAMRRRLRPKSGRKLEQTVKVSLSASMLSLRDVGQVVETGGFHRQGKGLVHSKHRVRTKAALTVLNTSF
jgi:hypothetical protein